MNEDALQPWLERSVCSDEVVHWKEFSCEGFTVECQTIRRIDFNRWSLLWVAQRTLLSNVNTYTSLRLILQRASSPQEA